MADRRPDGEYAVPDRVWATVLADIRTGKKLRRLSIDKVSDRSQPAVAEAPSGHRKTSSQGGSKASFRSFGRGIRHKFTQFFDSFGRKIEPFAGQHFHYHHAELPANLSFSLASSERASYAYESCGMLVVRVESGEASWVIRRTLDDLRVLDLQLHKCTFNRHYSRLDRPPSEAVVGGHSGEAVAAVIEAHASQYLKRLSAIARGTLSCGSVLGWFEVDNQGRRIAVSTPGASAAPFPSSAINVRAIAFARVTHPFQKQEEDELELQLGDLVSVIDMPSESESPWWRGKLGLEVGYFPRACVELIRTPTAPAAAELHGAEHAAPTPAPAAQAKLPSLAAKIGPGLLTKAKSAPALRVFAPSPQKSAPADAPAEPSKPAQALGKAIVAELSGGKLASHLRNFFHDRKAAGEALRRSGILRDPVFGADLAELCQRSGARVPVVVRRCFEEVEKRGLVRGIYRLSGVASKVQALRASFDANEAGVDLDPPDGLDIHCVAAVCKLYFRELPNPLLTFALYPEFVDCAQLEEGGAARETVLSRLTGLLARLPPPHFATVRLLVEHLSRLLDASDETQMDAKNLAIVWGPNIMRAPGGLGESVLHVKHQARIVEALIAHRRALFGRDSMLVLQSEADEAESLVAEREIMAAVAETDDFAAADVVHEEPVGPFDAADDMVRCSSAEYVVAETEHNLPQRMRAPTAPPPPIPTAGDSYVEDGREYAAPVRAAPAPGPSPVPPPRGRTASSLAARQEFRRSMSLGAADFVAASGDDGMRTQRSASNSAVRPKPLPRPPLKPPRTGAQLTHASSLDDTLSRERSRSGGSERDTPDYCDVEPRRRLGSAPDKPLPAPPPVPAAAAAEPRAPPKKLPRPPVKGNAG